MYRHIYKVIENRKFLQGISNDEESFTYSKFWFSLIIFVIVNIISFKKLRYYCVTNARIYASFLLITHKNR